MLLGPKSINKFLVTINNVVLFQEEPISKFYKMLIINKNNGIKTVVNYTFHPDDIFLALLALLWILAITVELKMDSATSMLLVVK